MPAASETGSAPLLESIRQFREAGSNAPSDVFAEFWEREKSWSGRLRRNLRWMERNGESEKWGRVGIDQRVIHKARASGLSPDSVIAPEAYRRKKFLPLPQWIKQRAVARVAQSRRVGVAPHG